MGAWVMLLKRSAVCGAQRVDRGWGEGAYMAGAGAEGKPPSGVDCEGDAGDGWRRARQA